MADGRKLKILMLPRYGREGPSSRYRLYQFLEVLEGCGHTCNISPLLSDKYITRFYSSGGKDRLEAVRGFLKRLTIIPKAFRYDLIIIEYELFAYFPPIFEMILKLTGRRYIVDYDDAIYERYSNHPCSLIRRMLGKKIDKVIRHASAVIVANKTLLNYVAAINRKVFLLPTVVSAARYDSEPTPDHKDQFTVGWIGSPTSARYLKSMGNVFRDLIQKGIRITLIGTGIKEIQSLESLGVECIKWDQEKEIRDIKKFSVGIMPLEDDEWSRGKSGFKLVQYMACRLPVIASPVGANIEIVDEGETGLFAKTTDDWVRAVLFLQGNQADAASMGEKGYRKFRDQYSLEAVSGRYVEIINLASR